MKSSEVYEVYDEMVKVANKLDKYVANFLSDSEVKDTLIIKLVSLKPGDVDTITRIVAPIFILYYNRDYNRGWDLLRQYCSYAPDASWNKSLNNFYSNINLIYNVALKNLGYIESDDEDDDVMEIEIEEDE